MRQRDSAKFHGNIMSAQLIGASTALDSCKSGRDDELRRRIAARLLNRYTVRDFGTEGTNDAQTRNIMLYDYLTNVVIPQTIKIDEPSDTENSVVPTEAKTVTVKKAKGIDTPIAKEL